MINFLIPQGQTIKNTGRQGKRKAVERIFHAAVAVGVGGISQQGV